MSDAPVAAAPSPAPAGHPRRGLDHRLVALLLMLATFAAFARTLSHEFVNYDDPFYVSRNVYVAEGLSWQSFKWAMSDTEGNYWHPATSLSHVIVGQFYGQSPTAHHAANVVLHAVNAALVFLVLRSLTRETLASMIAAGLFAVHPLRVESVAWATERSTLLCALFVLLAIAAYIAYVRRTGGVAWAAYGAVVVCLAIAMMAKPLAVTLPCVLLLLDAWPLRRFTGTGHAARRATALVLEKLPLFALVGGFTAAAIVAHERANLFQTAGSFTLPNRLGNVVVAYARYLWKTVCPINLSVDYAQFRPWTAAEIAFAAVPLVLITALVVFARRGRPYLLVGWLWFLGTLVPVTGLLQVRSVTLADRYTYLPHIGLFLAIAWLAVDFARQRGAEGVLRRASIAVFAVLGVTSWNQSAYWENSDALFGRALAVDPRAPLPRHHFANALARNGQLAAAEAEYRYVLSVRPDNAQAYLDLGAAVARQNRWAEAADYYERAIARKPKLTRARVGLGLALLRLGRLDESIRALEAALAANPRQEDAARLLAEARAAAATRPSTHPSPEPGTAATRPAL